MPVVEGAVSAVRMLVNPHTDLDRVPPPPDSGVEQFHRRLAGYAVTPAVSLDAVAGELGGGTVVVKDESHRCGLPSFKVLGASWALEQALRREAPVRTVVAASAGNHGRAVARCAARRRLDCEIYLPAGSTADRARLIAQEGAAVVRVDGGYDVAAAAAERRGRRPGAVLVADVSSDAGPVTPGWVVEGYSTMFREIGRQVPAPVDVVVVPVGVGSLAAAAVRWAVHEGSGARVVGVEPVTAACVTESLRAGTPTTVPTPGTTMAGLDCPTPSAPAWPTVRDGLTGTVTVSDWEVHDAMRELSALGLRIGDCGAATLAALRLLAGAEDLGELRAAIGLGRGSRVVCLGTEGASDPAAYRAVVEAAPGGARGRPDAAGQ